MRRDGRLRLLELKDKNNEYLRIPALGESTNSNRQQQKVISNDLCQTITDKLIFSQYPDAEIDFTTSLSALLLNASNVRELKRNGALGALVERLRRVDFQAPKKANYVSQLVDCLHTILMGVDVSIQLRLLANPYGVITVMKMCVNLTGNKQVMAFEILETLSRVDGALAQYVEEGVMESLLSDSVMYRKTTSLAVRHGAAHLLNKLTSTHPLAFPLIRFNESILSDDEKKFRVDAYQEVQLLTALHTFWSAYLLTHTRIALSSPSPIESSQVYPVSMKPLSPSTYTQSQDFDVKTEGLAHVSRRASALSPQRLRASEMIGAVRKEVGGLNSVMGGGDGAKNGTLPVLLTCFKVLLKEAMYELFSGLDHLLLIVKLTVLASSDRKHLEYMLDHCLLVDMLQYLARRDFLLYNSHSPVARLISSSYSHSERPSAGRGSANNNGSNSSNHYAPNGSTREIKFTSSVGSIGPLKKANIASRTAPSPSHGSSTTSLFSPSSSASTAAAATNAPDAAVADEANTFALKSVVTIYECVLDFRPDLINAIVWSGVTSSLLSRVQTRCTDTTVTAAIARDTRIRKSVVHFIYKLLNKILLSQPFGNLDISIADEAPLAPHFLRLGQYGYLKKPYVPRSRKAGGDFCHDRQFQVAGRSIADVVSLSSALHHVGVTSLLCETIRLNRDVETAVEAMKALAVMDLSVVKNEVYNFECAQRIFDATFSRPEWQYPALSIAIEMLYRIEEQPSETQDFLLGELKGLGVLIGAMKINSRLFPFKGQAFDCIVKLCTFITRIEQKSGMTVVEKQKLESDATEKFLGYLREIPDGISLICGHSRARKRLIKSHWRESGHSRLSSLRTSETSIFVPAAASNELNKQEQSSVPFDNSALHPTQPSVLDYNAPAIHSLFSLTGDVVDDGLEVLFAVLRRDLACIRIQAAIRGNMVRIRKKRYGMGYFHLKKPPTEPGGRRSSLSVVAPPAQLQKIGGETPHRKGSAGPSSSPSLPGV